MGGSTRLKAAAVLAAVLIAAACVALAAGGGDEEEEESAGEVSYYVEIFDMRESVKYGDAEDGRMWVYMQVLVYGTPLEYPAVVITYLDGSVADYEPWNVVTVDKTSCVRYCLYYDIEAILYDDGGEMDASIAEDYMEAVFPDTWIPKS